MTLETSIENRRDRVAELLSRHDFMSLTQISHALGVSESTARRDLERLEQAGLVRRTHGGAVFNRQSAGSADAVDVRLADKQAIARTVAELVRPGQTVLLNGGSTCLHIAAALVGRRHNIITNGVDLAARLAGDVGTEVTMIGGTVYPRVGVALGAMAITQLAEVHASQLITSCAAVSADGAFEPNQMMVEVERAMMQTADEVILAVDAGKLNSRSVVKLCDLGEIDVIVTNAAADASARRWLDSTDARVIYA